MPAVKGEGMRGLQVFISDIRACKYFYYQINDQQQALLFLAFIVMLKTLIRQRLFCPLSFSPYFIDPKIYRNLYMIKSKVIKDQ